MSSFQTIFQTMMVCSLAAYAFSSSDVEIDPKGYVVHCPCMGRFGNQMEHFLGVMSFAKGLDRTLILPHWIEFPRGSRISKQVSFDTYFQVEPLRAFHKVILMDDFMRDIAPTIWPEGKRISFCQVGRGGKHNRTCKAKDGKSFKSFWDTHNIEFDSSAFYLALGYDTQETNTANQWHQKFPPSDYPVMAFTGAPAVFPAKEKDVPNMAFLEWAKPLISRADEFLSTNFKKGAVLGIHMRNGPDWESACKHAEDSRESLFASAQCTGFQQEKGKITKELCFPPKERVIDHILAAVKKINAVGIFVASDYHHMIDLITDHIRKRKYKMPVLKLDENNPHLDLAILSKVDLYICNCISTFSSVAAKHRLTHGDKPTEFWAFDPISPKEEL